MFVRVMALVCAIPMLVSSATALADEPADAAESCVGFEKTDDEKAITYEAKNSCDHKLSCRLSWVVTCSDHDGNATARSKKAARFSLSESGSHSLTLSADACKQGWRIDDVTWACNGDK